MPDVIQRGLDEPRTPFAFHFALAMRHHPEGAATRLDTTTMDHSCASGELQALRGSSLPIEYHASLVSIHLSAIASVRNTTWGIFPVLFNSGSDDNSEGANVYKLSGPVGPALTSKFPFLLARTGCVSNSECFGTPTIAIMN